ncbi:drug/metabolite transporter (DMT)-like permease [Microlunatus panaciterrae]|uniref:Drug/metabolite transporter (DMT)-like permease n=1 Tax=Microlunatus panaciterrae TaxID=400768 RepID=A0ABS2RLC7_9ACTN|nr:DMT family transporter [Microlunatus panaciterrae]MBM7798724.1 drug/metabolite transporter (DMT)-like permease [Microlunatus panaciterrae]
MTATGGAAITGSLAAASNRTRSGLVLALTSAASFGLSGPLAKSLLETGWTPGAVVAFRIGGAGLLLLLPCLLLVRRSWRPTRRSMAGMTPYGVAAVAGAQLCYFSAVQYLSVGVALLIEYTAPVLLILWSWLRTRRRPSRTVLIGAGLAMLGLVLVLNLTGELALDPVGLLWAFGAAVGCCCYFLLADGNDDAVPPIVMTTAGTVIGALVLGLAAAAQVLPMHAGSRPTTLAGHATSWVLPAAGLVLITAVAAYLTGIAGIRRLGSSMASFVALFEVLFAVVFAIILLAEVPTWTQAVGGVLVIAGIVTVQRGQNGQRPLARRRRPTDTSTPPLTSRAPAATSTHSGTADPVPGSSWAARAAEPGPESADGPAGGGVDDDGAEELLDDGELLADGEAAGSR